uniref:Hamartin-like n=1 Tax=Dermatophagoides pteronyssinus TaxID=6956 RepID=A0A6P6XR96_DERPT|nr:putative uncharacterized protein DDB_G0282133 [Dermatophagoides pteronyssinus]
MVNNSNIQMQELLSKIQIVPNDQFESLYEQIFELLDESKHKTHERHFKENFIEKLVDLYLQTFSDRVFRILVGISSPLDECLFNILMKKINVQYNVEKRFAVFILISNVVHRSPSWLPNIINTPLLNCFFNILKNDQEIVILAISALILVELIAALPCLMTQCLDDIFVCFSRLSSFLYKGMNQPNEEDDKKDLNQRKNLSYLNLNSIVYRVFIRLYAMYPCNFLDYLKTNYGLGCNKENNAIFRKIIQPMLNKIRFHPFLITSSKNRECDKTRWFYKEPHDILEECCQYSIDPFESSYFVDDDLSQLYEFLTNEDGDNADGDGGGEICNRSDPPLYSTTISSNSIFSELNKTINENEQNLPSLCSRKYHMMMMTTDGKTNVDRIDNLESAQEAINMSQKQINSSSFIVMDDKQKSENNGKNLVKPVAIAANSKTSLLENSIQKRNISKKQSCFSPFKPIKEIGNIGTKNDMITSLSKTETASPIDNHLFNSNQLRNCNSVDHSQAINNNNDNEDVDIEIISYNLENENDKLSMNNRKNPANDISVIDKEEADKNDHQCQDSMMMKKLNDELVENVKSSFKHLNTRIRYQSNCQDETNDVGYDNDFGFSISTLLAMKKFSKSCPILYFENVDDNSSINELHKDNNQNVKEQQNNEHCKERRKCSMEKSNNRINLILENPNLHSNRSSTSTTVNKTCKSVDFTKEIRSLLFAHCDSSKNIHLNRLLHESKRHLLFQSSSSTSIDFQTTTTTPTKFEFSSPHELLDRTLSTLSEFYLKDLNERPTELNVDTEDSMINRRDSIPNNTNSNTNSIEHIPSLNYLNSNPNEEDMKKILAIMYAQLVFERHQRNLHVIRNRRLYKKSKESIQLEGQFKSMKAQNDSLLKEIELINKIAKNNSLKFEKERQLFSVGMKKLQENLNKYRKNYEELLNEKINLEQHYRLEIDGLNKNFRHKEVELNKFLCSFDKNIDLMKLEQENLELKNRMFLFGEYCGKIKDAYCHLKSMPDLNDKFINESLKFENEDLQKQNSDLGVQLKFYMEKCQTLENQIKQNETKQKEKISSNELDYVRECLKVKDDQIDVLKTLIVNYESHIKKLNGEMIALKLTPK